MGFYDTGYEHPKTANRLKICIKSNSSTILEKKDPVLLSGEIVVDKDKSLIKIGKEKPILPDKPKEELTDEDKYYKYSELPYVGEGYFVTKDQLNKAIDQLINEIIICNSEGLATRIIDNKYHKSSRVVHKLKSWRR